MSVKQRALPLAPEARRKSIIDAVIPLLLENGPNVTTAQIAEAAGIAEGTIFRVFPDKTSLLFEPGDSLLIDAGSTTTAFAEALGTVGRFTVITNSILVARELWNSPRRSEVHLLGGRYSGENHEAVGPHTIEQIQRLHADHAVLTIGAVDSSGMFMDYNADEAYVARAMIASARQTTILADSSKLCRHALFQVCEARSVQRLVTDKMPPASLAEVLRAAAVEVLVAEVPLT